VGGGADALDWLVVERGDLEVVMRGLTGEIKDSGGRAPDAMGCGESLLARALSAMAHFNCSSSVGTRDCSVLGS
jgi:hypothetical protein